MGWSADPGDAELADGNEFFNLFIADGAESGTISVLGNFATDDETTAPPASNALYFYLCNADAETDYVRGQSVIDPSTGDFTAAIDGSPLGYSKGILCFVVLESAYGGNPTPDGTVVVVDSANEGCSEALKIILEWDSKGGLEQSVTDPNGDRVSHYITATVVELSEHDRPSFSSACAFEKRF